MKSSVYALSLLLAISCRSTNQSEVKDAQFEGVAPSELFSLTCHGYGQLGDQERLFFNELIETMYKLETSNNPNDVWQIVTFVPSSQVVATHSCDEIWQKLQQLNAFSFSLSVGDISPIRMLAPIKGLRIRLYFDKFPKNLDVLKTLEIDELKLGRATRDYEPLSEEEKHSVIKILSQLTSVKELSIDELGISDMSGLAPLSAVQKLSISENGISDLTFLSHWLNLRRLEAPANRIRDLTPLKNILTLEQLDLSENEIDSIDPIFFLANLNTLSLAHNANLKAVLALSAMSNLISLDLEATDIKNIGPLRELPLIILNLSFDPVDSIEPLRGSPLENLYIKNTNVADLAPVATLAKLKVLNAEGVPVSTFPLMPQEAVLKTLSVKGTKIEDLCPIFAIKSLKTLSTPKGVSLNKAQIASAQCQPSPN